MGIEIKNNGAVADDTAYDATSWDNNLDAATKNVLRDKIETLTGIPASTFDANTILKADANDTPVALTVAAQRIIGRITAGVITDLTPAEVRTLISVADGADVTGDNAPKAHKTSHTDGTDDIQDASTSQKGLLIKADWDTFNDKQPVPTVYAKTTSATLTATEVSGLNTLHNDGAGGEVILTWLALVTGQEGLFYVNDAQYLQIKAPAATTIRIGAVQSAANGYVRSNVVGNWIKIKAMPDGLVVMGSGGIWTYDE